MFCPKCGKLIDDNAKYCPKCGCEIARDGGKKRDSVSEGTKECDASNKLQIKNLLFICIALIIIVTVCLMYKIIALYNKNDAVIDDQIVEADTPNNSLNEGYVNKTDVEIGAQEPTDYLLDDKNYIENGEDDTIYTVSLINGAGFSEGIAWVKYNLYKNGIIEAEKQYGLLRNDGKLTPLELSEDINDFGSEFSGGYSYINYRREDKKHFVIIDADGNTISESQDDAGYSIICGGDGMFLIHKEIRNMDTSEDLFGIIDVYGNYIYGLSPCFMYNYSDTSDVRGVSYEYLGCGYFQAQFQGNFGRHGIFNVILNTNNNTYTELDLEYYYSSFVEGLCDEKVVWSWTSSYEGGAYKVNDDGTTTNIWYSKDYNWVDVVAGDELIFVADKIDPGKGKYDSSAKFIDINGNTCIDLASYTVVQADNDYVIQTETINKFINGYAAIIIYGADGGYYLEIINRNGACEFDPIKISKAYTYVEGIMFCKLSGKNNISMIDCHGNITDCMLPENAFGTYSQLDFHEGYAYDSETNQYININGMYLETFIGENKPYDQTQDLNNESLVHEKKYIEFGRYEQDGDSTNGMEAIEWEILDENDESILLISRYILDKQKFNDNRSGVTWENCSLRKWLNNDFYEQAFSDDEKKRILETKVLNPDNIYNYEEGGNDTYDRIFCLSAEEVKKYYTFDSWHQEEGNGFCRDLIADTTEEVKRHDIINKSTVITEEDFERWDLENENYSRDLIGSGADSWWLRTPGNSGCYECFVFRVGQTGWKYYTDMTQKIGVRPVLYLKK